MTHQTSTLNDSYQGLLVSAAGNFSFTIKTLAEQRSNDKAYGCTSHYKLVFLTRGECQYLLDRRNIAVDDLSIGIVKPHQSFENVNYASAEGYIISFSYDYLQLAIISSPLIQQLHLGISNLDTVPVPVSEHNFLADVSSRLMQEYGMSNGMREEVVRGLFQVFALYLSRATAQLKPAAEVKSNRYTKRFFSLLDQHFRTLKMPADYADLMAVTPAYLNNVIKDNLGFTTSYFIQQRILTEAKRLMMFEELNMKEVAYSLGFFDVSHFSKFFKRITGKRFTDFKRNVAA
jgi:AraC family transcriptional activator of pobA